MRDSKDVPEIFPISMAGSARKEKPERYEVSLLVGWPCKIRACLEYQ
jgi:hypothetical protein